MLTGVALAGPLDAAQVGPGLWRPSWASEEEPLAWVDAFRLDRTPVTRGELMAFIQAHPEWRRDRVSRIRADEGYLASWVTPELADGSPHAPAVQVSWFLAKAYCADLGGRLPTEAEWELAAAAGQLGPDGRAEPGHVQRILSWYARPTPPVLPDVARSGPPDWWGIYDLHGLIWEWVQDFNSILVSSDNREQGGADTTKFCGAGAVGAADREDYAAFMRTALRSALRGDSTTSSLGFRCAWDY